MSHILPVLSIDPMKQPALKGKAPIKKAISAVAQRVRRHTSDTEKEPVDRVLTREQIDLFCKLVRTELPKKIAEIDQLRRREFNYERMKQKYLMGEGELKKNFVAPHSRTEVDAYQEMYILADLSSESFLFPNGLIPANHAMDELVKILVEHLENLQGLTSQCLFALELAVPPYEKRSAFEYSLLQDITTEFVNVSNWALSQHASLHSSVLDFHGKEMISIACYPQYEDRRKAYIRSEKKQLKELIAIVNNFFFVSMNLFDVVCKNGDKLTSILYKARTGIY